jgi:polyferredoxin
MNWIIANRGRGFVKLIQWASSGNIYGLMIAEFMVIWIAGSIFGEKLLKLRVKPTEEGWAKTRRLGLFALFLSILPFSCWNFTLEKNKPIDDFLTKFGILSGATLFFVFLASIAGGKCKQFSPETLNVIDHLFDDSESTAYDKEK